MPVRRPAIARDALLAFTGDPLGETPVGPQVGEQLGTTHGARTLVRRLSAAGDRALGAGRELGSLLDLPPSRAQCGLRRVAGGIGIGHRAAVTLDSHGRLRLGGRGLSRCGNQSLTPGTLFEQPLGSTGRRLRQLPTSGVEEPRRCA